MKQEVINQIRSELKQNIDKKYKIGVTNYFKEPVNFMGVRTPTVRKIAAKYWKEVKDLDKQEIFKLCEQLLKGNQKNPFDEEATIAYAWAYNLKDKYTRSDWSIFERWFKTYVTNWGKCDDFCTHVIGRMIACFPELRLKMKPWIKSKNRWLRRAAAISYIYPVRKEGKYLSDIFKVSDQLLLDEDDLVQKGYGWTLKEASNVYQREVFNYVMSKKHIMPRTALRYAIEKMPPSLKKRAMSK